MNKNELVDVLAERCRLTKKDAGAYLDGFVETLGDALHDGEEVKIPGLGIFAVKVRAAHVGRNPANGEEIQIPASKSVSFKAGKQLKDLVK